MAVLFVGNGINLNEDISVSWKTLLEKLHPESTSDISDALGMTLRYEYIDSVTSETGNRLKKKIAKAIRSRSRRILKKEDSIHQTLMGLGLDCILTTNYDYALEMAADADFKPSYNTREQLYSFRRYQESAGMTVYHIHGECQYPASICLGFEHYAGMLEKMRSKIVKSTEKELGGKHLFHLYDVLSGLTPPGEEWYYRMFTDDIYFLGFGFAASEEDTWWLLTYRKRLIKEYPNLVQNHIFYLDTEPYDQKTEMVENAKRKMLAALNVNIIPFTGDTYYEKYDNAGKYLKKTLSLSERELTYV